jgi:hypothetical protein
LLRPGIPFKLNWHIDAMTHKVSQVASGETKRLIITVPPRHLKSIIASVALPAWYLGHNPSERVVCVSYSAELAKTHANDFRRVVTDLTYQASFRKCASHARLTAKSTQPCADGAMPLRFRER